MIKLISALALAATCLTGCVTTGGTTISSNLTPANVMAVALATCSFLPEATTITDLFTKAPQATTAEAVAKIICDAVGPKPAVGASGMLVAAKAGNVAVVGKFVQ